MDGRTDVLGCPSVRPPDFDICSRRHLEGEDEREREERVHDSAQAETDASVFSDVARLHDGPGRPNASASVLRIRLAWLSEGRVGRRLEGTRLGELGVSFCPLFYLSVEELAVDRAGEYVDIVNSPRPHFSISQPPLLQESGSCEEKERVEKQCARAEPEKGYSTQSQTLYLHEQKSV
ncbi:uncharacterized protein BKA78DRAFT_307858 [Phyllosticta capitalensis]|uniref:uncharacterized protein n=1 Tax=Phyllosticta capitalensis TaxID=121624 RepID=UPI003130F59A